MNIASPMQGNPFPGLRPFRQEEEYLFFGRERQVDTLVDRLCATHFLAVVGTSGSGKSSLVNCGLVPALHRGLMAQAGSAWRVACLRPGNRPIAALAEALAAPGVLTMEAAEETGFTRAELVEATLRLSKLGLIDMFEQSHRDASWNLLVVVDQFEELFRYRALAEKTSASASAGDDAIAFVNLLLEAGANCALPVYIVLTMRSDFLGDCAQFFGLPEAINRGQYLVPRMTRE
jgi:ABC-type cobalamin/Fe3+-siderophores transport system ATPase subunit